METYISKKTGERATAEQIYAAWNWGIGNLQRVNFDVTRAPNQVQNRAKKLIVEKRKYKPLRKSVGRQNKLGYNIKKQSIDDISSNVFALKG